MIGIVIEDIKNFDLDRLNQETKNDCVIFTDCVLPPKEYKNLAFFTTSLAYDFSGPLVSTCILSSLSILDMPLCARKFFLAPTFLWTQENLPYRTISHIYNNDNLEILATNREQAEVIETFFKPASLVNSVLDIKEK